MKKIAYDKTIKVIGSCHDLTTLEVAERFMNQYVRLFVQRQDEIFHLAYLMQQKRTMLNTNVP